MQGEAQWNASIKIGTGIEKAYVGRADVVQRHAKVKVGIENKQTRSRIEIVLSKIIGRRFRGALSVAVSVDGVELVSKYQRIPVDSILQKTSLCTQAEVQTISHLHLITVSGGGVHGAVQPVAGIVGHDSEAHAAVHPVNPLVIGQGVGRISVGPLRPLVAVVGGEAGRERYSCKRRIGLNGRGVKLAEHRVLGLKRNDGHTNDAERKEW